MTGQRKALAVLLVLCSLLLTAAGCGSQSDPENGTAGSQPESAEASGEVRVPEGEAESRPADGRPGMDFPEQNTENGVSDIWELADGLTDGFDPDYSDRDTAGTYDRSEAVQVILSDEGIQAGGFGVTAEGNAVTVSQAGVYLFSGSLSDGRIIVDIDNPSKDDKVQIVLNHVDITCEDGPALWIKSADKVFLTLAAGTQNTLTDGSSYSAAEADGEAAGTDSPNAAVWSDCDLTVNGTGSLTVNGRYNNGIGTKDDLVITGGTLTVTAVNNGLKGKDSVAVCGGQITVTAGGDTVKSDQDNSTEKGWISIDGGILILSAGEKGLSAQNDIYITDGSVEIDSADDCVHANDSLHIAGGSLKLKSDAKGIHGDNALWISGGQITVSSCTEGLEAKTITVDDGEINITASDDGINASDGSGTDLFGMGGPGQWGGQNGTEQAGNGQTETATIYIEINGGTLYINAEGDGIDSNGTLMINGGQVCVDGPVSGGDGALDYAGAATVTGGTMVAVGSAQMAANFTAAENQCAWMVNASQVQKAGSVITISDESGTVLLRYTPEKDYQSIVVSCPQLQQGGTYTAAVDGAELETVTLSELVTGSGSMMGGFHGGFGGGKPDGDRRGGGPGGEMPDGQKPGGEMPGDERFEDKKGDK